MSIARPNDFSSKNLDVLFEMAAGKSVSVGDVKKALDFLEFPFNDATLNKILSPFILDEHYEVFAINSPQYTRQMQELKASYESLCLPNEDFGKRNSRSGVSFRGTLRAFVAQIETLTSSQSASKRHARPVVAFSKIFVWGA